MSLFKESFIHEVKEDQHITIRTDCEFQVYISPLEKQNWTPYGPDSVNDRVFKHRINGGHELFIEFEGNCAFEFSPIGRKEKPDPMKLVENIPDTELSMYDRMRAELLSELSQFAENRGDESFDEANDLELEEDDETPLTPYEYSDMAQEYLKDNPPGEVDQDKVSQVNSDSDLSDEPETPSSIDQQEVVNQE